MLGLGVPEGPDVGRILRAVEADWIHDGFPAGKEALLAIARQRLESDR